LRLAILILTTFTAFSTRSYAVTDQEILCHRHVDPKTELTEREHYYLMRQAQRLHQQLHAKWGKFVGFRDAIVYGDELHVVASFDLDGRAFEIVIVYDPKLERAIYAVVPNPSGRGVEEYAFK
jgi:hypothetical protein